VPVASRASFVATLMLSTVDPPVTGDQASFRPAQGASLVALGFRRIPESLLLLQMVAGIEAALANEL
jgi:hypothetical protein